MQKKILMDASTLSTLDRVRQLQVVGKALQVTLILAATRRGCQMYKNLKTKVAGTNVTV